MAFQSYAGVVGSSSKLDETGIAMSNIATLKPITKGDPRGGRVKGQVNRITRALKTALILAAEKSEHCPKGNKSLEGYCLYLANKHPVTFAGLLGKLIPVQARVKAEGNARIDFEKLKLNLSMPLEEMIRNFEIKIKSGYCPPPPVLIEHDDDDDDEPDA